MVLWEDTCSNRLQIQFFFLIEVKNSNGPQTRPNRYWVFNVGIKRFILNISNSCFHLKGINTVNISLFGIKDNHIGTYLCSIGLVSTRGVNSSGSSG